MFKLNLDMRINAINQIKCTSIMNKNSNGILKTMPSDVVSFSAMKKSQFNGIDLFVVNRFKAPIEKFNSNQDFQNWCLDKVNNEYSYENFKSDDKAVNKKRKEMINEWQNYIRYENDDYNNAVLLMAMQGVTKHLKPKNNELPLSLNKGILAQTIFEIKNEIEKNPKVSFDFNKLYSANLANHFLEDDEPVSDMTGWIIIPSKKNDVANFKENVEKVRALSHKSWCTKTNNAHPYLSEGDFHVYVEKGYPKLGIRFTKNKVREIQGELNNGKIPFQYADICLKHIEGFPLDFDAQEQIQNLRERKCRLEQIKIDLAESIKNNDVEEILNYFGIKVEKAVSQIKTDDVKDLYDIDSYSAIQDGISFSEMGIDENKLFDKIQTIKGTANFSGSEVTDLGALTYIGGNAIFENSKIKNLNNLFLIEGNADFKNSNVRFLGDLRMIEGNADFENSYLTSLNKLEKIGGNARFNNSKVSDLGALKHIGGYANFSNSRVDDFKNLEYIGGEIIDKNGRYVSNPTIDVISGLINKIEKFFSSFKNKN